MHDRQGVDEEDDRHDEPCERPSARKNRSAGQGSRGGGEAARSESTDVVGETLDAPTRLNENQKANDSVKNRKAGICCRGSKGTVRQLSGLCGDGRRSWRRTSRNLGEAGEVRRSVLGASRRRVPSATAYSLSVVHDGADVELLQAGGGDDMVSRCLSQSLRAQETTHEDEAVVDPVADPDLEVEEKEERKDDGQEEGAVDLEQARPGRDDAVRVGVEGYVVVSSVRRAHGPARMRGRGEEKGGGHAQRTMAWIAVGTARPIRMPERKMLKWWLRVLAWTRRRSRAVFLLPCSNRAAYRSSSSSIRLSISYAFCGQRADGVEVRVRAAEGEGVNMRPTEKRCLLMRSLLYASMSEIWPVRAKGAQVLSEDVPAPQGSSRARGRTLDAFSNFLSAFRKPVRLRMRKFLSSSRPL